MKAMHVPLEVSGLGSAPMANDRLNPPAQEQRVRSFQDRFIEGHLGSVVVVRHDAGELRSKSNSVGVGPD